MRNGIIEKVKKWYIPGTVFLAIVLGLCYLYGDKAVYGDWVIFDSVNSIRLCKMAVAYFVAFYLIYYGFENAKKWKLIPDGFKNKIEGKIFWICFFLLEIIWLPHLLVKYPACSSSDTMHQCRMVLGISPLTTHHPIMHTLLMGVFLHLGQLLNSLNVGLFLFSLFEMLVYGMIFSYAISFFSKKKVADVALLFAIAFFAGSPYISGYIASPLKDCLFSSGCVLLTVCLSQYVFDKEKLFLTRKDCVIFVLATSMVIWFRNNGIYLVFAVLVTLAWLMRKGKSKRVYRTLACALLVPILVQSVITFATKPEKGNIREMFCLPVQQTARFVRDHEELVSPDEKVAISEVLPYDTIGEAYTDYWADPVKNTLNFDENRESLIRYVKAWFCEFWKAPKCYFDATASQNIYLLYPRYNTYKYYYDANANEDPLFERPEKLEALKDAYSSYLESLHTLPILKYVNNMACYMIFLFAFSLYLLKQRKKNIFLVLLPAYISFLVIIAAPGIRSCIRYAFPIVWSVPIWICCYLRGIDDKKI